LKEIFDVIGKLFAREVKEKHRMCLSIGWPDFIGYFTGQATIE
jgi:hypothetical protein